MRACCLSTIAYDKLPSEADISAITSFKERIRVGRIVDSRRKDEKIRIDARNTAKNLKHLKSLELSLGDWTNWGEYLKVDNTFIYITNKHGGISQTLLSNPNLLDIERSAREDFYTSKSSLAVLMLDHIKTASKL